jgi:hypothetical protein
MMVQAIEYLTYGILYVCGTGVAAGAVAVGVAMLRDREWAGMLLVIIGILVFFNMVVLTLAVGE